MSHRLRPTEMDRATFIATFGHMFEHSPWIVETRCGVAYSENGMLRLLHDLGLSWQKTRPVHPQADSKAQARFKKFAALMVEVARDHPDAERLEVWFLDEARVGQTGRLGRRWYQKGTRPRDGA
jgi:Winged helix-turn helix